MRLAWLVLVVGCTSNPVTYGAAMTCQSVPANCAADECPTLDQALNHPQSCADAHGYVECDGWTIIYTGDMVAWETYYRDGQFVARVTHDHTAPATCVGPASFPVPSCGNEPTMPLPACQ